MIWIVAATTILVAYLLGSLPFAVIISRLMRLQDPRQFGSKNPGATNVLRSGNKTAAALTLLGDLLKGSVAVWLAQTISSHFEPSNFEFPNLIVAFSAIAVFLGHVFPITLGFKGGKGVATAVGVLLAIEPLLALLCLASWLLVAYTTRYSSLAAIIAAVLAPAYYLLLADSFWPLSKSLAASIIVLSALLLWRHKANISRLLEGKESRIGSK